MKELVKTIKGKIKGIGVLKAIELLIDLEAIVNDREVFIEDELGDDIYIECPDEEWCYWTDEDEIKKIIFRMAMEVAGINPNFATWLWYNKVEEAKGEIVADELILSAMIEDLVEAIKVASELKKINKIQGDEMKKVNYLKELEEKLSEAQRVASVIKEREELLKQEVLMLLKNNTEAYEFVMNALIVDDISTKKDLMNLIHESDYISHSWAGYIGQRNYYSFLIKRGEEIIVVGDVYGYMEYSDNGTITSKEWYSLPLQTGDIVIGVSGEEAYYNQGIVEEENEFSYLLKNPIIWDNGRCKVIQNKIETLKGE